MFENKSRYRAIVIGSSAGGLLAVSSVLRELPRGYPLPIIIVQHRANDHSATLEQVLQHRCLVTVKQADEKEVIAAGIAYVAPPGYHLLIEDDLTFSLSSDTRVKHSMPSIDVLFESAAAVYRDALVAIILTGASDDGSAGIIAVKAQRGLTIAQDPGEAQFPYMPRSAIETGAVTSVRTLNQIAEFVKALPENK